LVLVPERCPTADPRRLDWGQGNRLVRAVAGDPEALQAGFDSGDLALEWVLDAATAEWARGRPGLVQSAAARLVVSLRPFDTLAEATADGVDPRAALASLHPATFGLLDVPVCLAPWALPVDEPWTLEAGVVGPNDTVDLVRFTDSFLRRRYRVFSLRCAGCSARSGCPGLPIQLARHSGLSLLRPLATPKP
jgi:hypothetical protein